MKIQVIANSFGQETHHYHHTFLSLSEKNSFLFYEGGPLQDKTTHVLILNIPSQIFPIIPYLQKLKNHGIKIIIMIADEFLFLDLEILLQLGLIDKILIPDKKYSKAFYRHGNIVEICDYIANENMFPKNIIPIHNNKKCYYGHLLYDRKFSNHVDYISQNLSYKNLFDTITQYKGVLIFDTNGSAYSNDIVHNNKAKALEALMCGRQAYCQSGVSSLTYEHLLNKFENEDEIKLDIKEIRDINNKNIEDFANKVINV